MLKIINNIKFIPNFGVKIRINDYWKYFHWLCFYIIWNHKSIFSIYEESDKKIIKEFNRIKKIFE